MSIEVFPPAAAGFDPTTVTAQQTFNTSSNNVSVPGKNWVYAVLAGGGSGGGRVSRGSNIAEANGGPGGGIAFGLVPVNSSVVIGSGGSGASGTTGSQSARGLSGGFSTYSSLRANGGWGSVVGANTSSTFGGWHNQFTVDNIAGAPYANTSGMPGFSGGTGFPGQYISFIAGTAPLMFGALSAVVAQPFVGGIASDTNGGNGATGAGGSSQINVATGLSAYSGGNSTVYPYNGGAGGIPNTTGNAAAGSGGGAGITGNGNAGQSNNDGGRGGNGGSGGTGGGGGGAGGGSSNIAAQGTGSGGTGGSGALILYY